MNTIRTAREQIWHCLVSSCQALVRCSWKPWAMLRLDWENMYKLSEIVLFDILLSQLFMCFSSRSVVSVCHIFWDICYCHDTTTHISKGVMYEKTTSWRVTNRLWALRQGAYYSNFLVYPSHTNIWLLAFCIRYFLSGPFHFGNKNAFFLRLICEDKHRTK